MKGTYTCGVDIGGSHITAAVFDAGLHMVENSHCRAPVNTSLSPDEIITAWAQTIRQAIIRSNCKVTDIGIAIPGPFDYEAGISFINNQGKLQSLYNRNVKAMLADKLQFGPQYFRFTNDAESFLKGEVAGGVAAGYKHVLGLTLGTGFGSASSSNGMVADAALWCRPFKTSIADEYFSTRWFKTRYKELTGKTALHVQDLAAQAYDGNIAALEIFKEFGENLALFITPILDDAPVEMIVVGGNIANAFNLFDAAITNRLPPQHKQVIVRQSILGENAALIGSTVADSPNALVP